MRQTPTQIFLLQGLISVGSLIMMDGVNDETAGTTWRWQAARVVEELFAVTPAGEVG
jgi:hypothetical protein